MQAVILAAGKGTRMFPMATEKPKPLITVANKPVLMHNLDQMVGLAEEAVIVVGYKKDMIIETLGNVYRGIRLKYVVQEEQRGTGHALMLAEEHISGKFLVLNGDDLFSRRDMEMLSHHAHGILVQYKEDTSAFGVVVVEEGIVKNIVEKPKEFVSHFVNTGMYCFTPEVFPILKSLTPSVRGEYELTDAVKVLVEQGKMCAEEVQGHWIPVGYPWHILEATEELLKGASGISIKGTIGQNVAIHGSLDVGEGTEIKDNVFIQGNVVIGKNCVIEDGVKLIGSIALGDNTVVQAGAELRNVIAGSGTQIQAGCVVCDSVLGEGAVLKSGVKVDSSSDGSTVKVHANGKVYDSGREQLGAFVGDKCTVHRELQSGECFSKEEE